MIKRNHKQGSERASQAALQPINESRFFARGLLDGLTRTKNLQKWLSDSSRGIWSVLLSIGAVSIHTFSLWMLVPESGGTIPTLPGTNHLGTGRMETGCSGTPPAEAKTLRRLPREFQWLPVGVSLTGHGTDSTRKQGWPLTKLLSIPTPLLSAPAAHLPCQGQPLERTTTNEWSGLPVCSRSKAARYTLAGAEQVTRSRLDTWNIESGVL